MRPRRGDNDNPGPLNAVVFTTHGNYGSTVFDPMHPDGLETLEIHVCDDCLTRHATHRVLHVRRSPQPPIYEREPWQP